MHVWLVVYLLAQFSGHGCRPVASIAESDGRATLWRCGDGSWQVEKNGEVTYFEPPDRGSGCRWWTMRRTAPDERRPLDEGDEARCS